MTARVWDFDNKNGPMSCLVFTIVFPFSALRNPRSQVGPATTLPGLFRGGTVRFRALFLDFSISRVIFMVSYATSKHQGRCGVL